MKLSTATLTLVITAAAASLTAASFQADSRPASRPTSQAPKAPWKGPTEELQSAVFAGGCFWCMESSFETVPGVAEVLSGYTGGKTENPSYHEVGRGTTGHTEAIEVYFDPTIISYNTLLDFYWRQFDPTDAGGSFVDRGSQYRSGIFVANEEQRQAAKASKAKLAKDGPFEQPIVTPIETLTRFWPAEEYHQDYYLKEPEHYHRYRSGSGRDEFCDGVWGAARQLNFGPLLVTPKARFHKPSDAELKRRLSAMAYKVTQEDATERAFQNEYWDLHEDGIFVDVVSGEPLFSSKDKFESGTGWPSFTRPLIESNIATGVDHKLGYPRDELRSAHADSHLGHVFDDGPEPTGKRYCINSAALRFVPADKLLEEGYRQFAPDFGIEVESQARSR